MKAEKGGYLVSSFDVIVTYRTLPGLAVIDGFPETGPIFFDCVGVDFLRIHSEVNDSLLHHHSSVVSLLWILSKEPGYEISVALCFFKLKLALNDVEHIVISLYFATHP